MLPSNYLAFLNHPKKKHNVNNSVLNTQFISASVSEISKRKACFFNLEFISCHNNFVTAIKVLKVDASMSMRLEDSRKPPLLSQDAEHQSLMPHSAVRALHSWLPDIGAVSSLLLHRGFQMQCKMQKEISF